MSFSYYASLAPGLQPLAAELVKNRFRDGVIKKPLEGALIFETTCPRDRLELFCFNNIFAVLDIMEGVKGDRAIETHMGKICRKKHINLSGSVRGKDRSFRIVCSRANQLVRVNEGLKRTIESRIAGETGLRTDRSNPGREYWFLYRDEGLSLFMERLTRHRSFDKALHPGELPPPLAYLMCWAGNLKKTDTVLDPFCGYGSIPEQGLKHFSPQKFFALDIKKEAVEFSRNKLQVKRPASCRVEQRDIHNIFSLLPEGSVDKIITDPPWGSYEQLGETLGDFYDDMVKIFYRLLKEGGRIVVLTAAKDEFTAAVSRVKGLAISSMYHILVSGKKAGLFIVGKV